MYILLFLNIQFHFFSPFLLEPCSDYIGKCFKERDHATFGIEFECLYEKMCSCVKQQGGTLESFYDITAYLYPFTIEFSILAGKLLDTGTIIVKYT